MKDKMSQTLVHVLFIYNLHINKSFAISELCYKNKHIPKVL